MYTQYLYIYNIINYVYANTLRVLTRWRSEDVLEKKKSPSCENCEKNTLLIVFFSISCFIMCAVYPAYTYLRVYTLLNSCLRFCVNSLLLSPRCPPRNHLAICPSAVNCFSSVQPFQNRKKPVASTRLHHGAQIVVCFPDKSNQEQNFAGFSWENHTDWSFKRNPTPQWTRHT